MEIETLSCGWVVKDTRDNYKIIDYNGKNRYLYTYTSPIDIAVINQLQYPNIVNVSLALSNKPCDNSYSLVLMNTLSTRAVNVDPINILHKISRSLSVIHSRGIYHLSIGKNSIKYIGKEPILNNFKSAKLFHEYLQASLPEDNIDILPPEYADIVGGFTDIWMLGFYILNMYGIYKSVEITPYNYYVVKKLVDDFYEEDWTTSIEEYYVSLPEIKEKAVLIHNFYEDLGEEAAISKYYSSDAEDIEALTDVIEDVEQLEEKIKELEGAKITAKVSFINNILHRMMELDYTKRITSYDLEKEISTYLDIAPSRGETYDLEYGGNTSYNIDKARSFINKLYNICIVNKYTFSIFCFSLSYAFNLMDIITNEDDLVRVSLDIAVAFCNNTPLSESLFAYLKQLNYYLYISKMYTYARNDKHILTLTEQLASGNINYFTYDWESIADDTRFDLNKPTINAPVYSV